MSSDEGARELKAGLINRAPQIALAKLFKDNQTEVRSILREVISTTEGRERMRVLMESEQGREFLGRLSLGLGVKIGGDDLWITEGGRKLVKQLMSSGDGRSAIFTLITGF
jgi:hypothetical protein